MGKSKAKPAKESASAPSAAKPSKGLAAVAAWRYRQLVIALVVVVALAFGLRAAWQRWGEPTTSDPAYNLTADQIEVSPAPAYIHADIKADVIRDAHLTTLNLRDRQLLDKVTRAFALHSWVAKVRRVQKAYPSRVVVELDYRKPVAVVEIGDRDEAGLLFIDEASVLLPSDNFAPTQTRDFLRIAAEGARPTGVYGTAWGSKRILGAAQIAAAWGDRWKPLDLYRIVIKQDPNSAAIYELHSRGEARVIWGNPPGQESQGEPTAAEKIEALAKLVQEHGPLDKSASLTPIDLRHAVPSRTAKTGAAKTRS